MSGDMWLCAVVACAVLIIVLIVLLVRMRRKTDHEMLYAMAGPVTVRGPRRVSKDVQVLACELAGKMASDLGK